MPSTPAAVERTRCESTDQLLIQWCRWQGSVLEKIPEFSSSFLLKKNRTLTEDIMQKDCSVIIWLKNNCSVGIWSDTNWQKLETHWDEKLILNFWRLACIPKCTQLPFQFNSSLLVAVNQNVPVIQVHSTPSQHSSEASWAVSSQQLYYFWMRWDIAMPLWQLW